MSYHDFLRAMTAYTYSPKFEAEDVANYLKDNKPEILKIVDADGDGTISFTEYFFFLVLLQCHSNKIRKVFRKHADKETKTMTKENATPFMRELRMSTQAGGRQQDKAKVDARAIKASDEDFLNTNKAIVEQLFKGDKTTMTQLEIVEL